ncbi:MAG: hypothetical protein LBE12_06615 [Planctomycetaceae bacterium]|nr:hypothetical protein [Planctomycetaceae bacterium]
MIIDSVASGIFITTVINPLAALSTLHYQLNKLFFQDERNYRINHQ